MEKILTDREGTVYSAAEYITNLILVDDHIRMLCEMIQLVFHTIPEGKCVDPVLLYNFLKALQEICRVTGIEFDFNSDYTCHIDVGETKHHDWISSTIKDETYCICKRYNLTAPTGDMTDYRGDSSNLSAVGILHLWICKNAEEMYYHL